MQPLFRLGVEGFQAFWGLGLRFARVLFFGFIGFRAVTSFWLLGLVGQNGFGLMRRAPRPASVMYIRLRSCVFEFYALFRF